MNRYCGIDEEEYGAYWIVDLINCEKTKEDFLDKDKEIYDIYAWEDYLNKHGRRLTKDNVVSLINGVENLAKYATELEKEIISLKKENKLMFTENNKLRVTMIYYKSLEEDIKWLKENMRVKK